MELALIPPISLLDHTKSTKVQLMLPQLLKPGADALLDKYSITYLNYCLSQIDYVIMDNGAAEKEQLRNDQLVTLLRTYGPDEFAIPDVLGNAEQTLGKAEAFFYHHQGDMNRINNERDSELKLGFVAQGRTVKEVVNIISRLTIHSWADNISVIYIPRLLIKATGDSMARMKVFEHLWRRYGNLFEYHLFGAASSFPAEIVVASAEDNLRSMDTSLPYVMAYHKTEFDPKSGQKEITRPNDYFNLPAESFPDAGKYVDYFLNALK